MRPDRPAVVGEPREAWRVGREGAQPEPGVHPGVGEQLHDPLGRLLAEQPGAEQVTHVGGHRVDRGAVAVQRDGDVTSLRGVDPELLREPLPQVGRPRLQPRHRLGVVGREQGRAAHRRLVGVGLHLAERDRRLGQPAVGELHGVVAVLPALVGQAVPGPVDVPDPATVGGLLDQPGQAAPGGRQQVPGPGPGRPPSRRRRRASRRTAGWRRPCRSRAGAGSAAGGGSALRTSCRILPGCSSVASSSRVPCRRASTRSVESASPESKGTSIRAHQSESRPNSVTNHGLPAATNLSPSSDEQQAPEVGQALLGRTPDPRVRGASTATGRGAGRPASNGARTSVRARSLIVRRSPRSSRSRQVRVPDAGVHLGRRLGRQPPTPGHRQPGRGRLGRHPRAGAALLHHRHRHAGRCPPDPDAPGRPARWAADSTTTRLLEAVRGELADPVEAHGRVGDPVAEAAGDVGELLPVGAAGDRRVPGRAPSRRRRARGCPGGAGPRRTSRSPRRAGPARRPRRAARRGRRRTTRGRAATAGAGGLSRIGIVLGSLRHGARF